MEGSRHGTKLRHTKPCRYFQSGQCVHSAEECDFAHVKSQPTPSCRYYAAGYCGNGVGCHFQHSMVDDISINREVVNDIMTKPEHYDEIPFTMPSPTAVFLSPYSGVYPYAATSGPSPFWLPTQFNFEHGVPIIANSTSLAPTSPQTRRWSAGSSSSATSSSSNDTTVYLDASDYIESTAQSPVDGGSSVDLTPPPLVKPRYSRGKVANFKTKPCRFYVAGKPLSCPNRAECTFIHEHPGERPRPSLPSLVGPMTPVRDASKPTSPKLTKPAAGYFPVPWRVIGGGVLMGDPKLLHDSETDHATPSGVLAAPFQLNIDPTVILGSSRGRSPCPERSRKRRSSSIPPTPSINQVDAHTLFSAESPGGL